ncbi:histidine phosphatase family protein [Actinomycetes bacterium M1A6_2h]
MTVKLAFVSHAATEATRSVRFPADEPLNVTGLRDVEKVDGRALVRGGAVLSAPERRTVDTAQHLGLSDVHVEDALRDVDYGWWTGKAMTDLGDDELHAWLTDPRASPHGGESVSDVVTRVAGWLRTLDEGSRTLTVTHPAVVRAAVVVALGAPLQAFWRIDVMPLSLTSMHRRGNHWTLRCASSRL